MKNTIKVLGIIAFVAVIGFSALSLTGCQPEETKQSLFEHDATELTEGEWTDGSIPTKDDEQWFKFTATANPQYIHLKSGTMLSGVFKLYTSSGALVGGVGGIALPESISSTTPVTASVSISKEYYIKITPFMTIIEEGEENPLTYQITFSSLIDPPVPSANVTELAEDVFVDGSLTPLPIMGGEQWFKFTATAGTQYIHFKPGTVSSINLQLYNTDGTKKGDGINSIGLLTTSPATFTVTNGTVYYIYVTSSSRGTYQIGFNKTTAQPPITFPEDTPELTAGASLSSGNLKGSWDEQWFKFTATAATQYILVNTTTTGASNIKVQLYKADGRSFGENLSLFNYNSPFPITVTADTEYHIKVTAIIGGSYQIGFSEDFPPTRTTSPVTATELTVDNWSSSTINTTTSEQWFKFTATAATQYIHFKPGTTSGLTNLYIQLYNEDGTALVGDYGYLLSPAASSYNPYISRAVTNESTYYIKVTRGTSTGTSYQIGFTTSTTPPTTP